MTMHELPIFPLNTVLFPGTPLQLHIFEERYKEMINMCIREKRNFGVALIQEGKEALGNLPKPHIIGCSASILNVQRLKQQRMNIVALGQERFRIISTDRESNAYLSGIVESYPIKTIDPGRAISKAEHLYPKVEVFIRRLVEAGGMKYNLQQLPEDPEALAYMAAAMLQISPSKKQSLLELDELDQLLFRLVRLYQHELALLDILLTPSAELMHGGFSIN